MAALLSRSTFAFVALASTLAVSCIDPVNQDAEDALGPEAPGVPEGPTHRPGQPCLTCHGEVGPGSPKMEVGGTVFQGTEDGAPGAAGVTVRLTDATGHVEERITNSVGNFYVFLEEWEPKWPLRVALQKEGQAASEMKTLLNGRTGCATCHRLSGNATSTRLMPKLSY